MMKIKIVTTLTLMMALSACSSEQPSPSPQRSSTTAARTAPVAVGEMALDFTLEDQQKRNVTLSASLAKSPVVLVFYRGNW